ncbi:LemA family protein [Methylomicrobium sp. RS1]|uniref:LemA family protein n=1 Tax=Candidatus Methylomicrobium oryzae TaxID=2802053 RepID=UPI0019226E66|nr:LemA family protein [Methylomicrobium sp. RS1]MBL1263987.1 LemA family protein [Methylomicrobium sp. RS1]
MIAIFLGILLFLILIFVLLYNALVAKKNAVGNAFGALDAMLKKRYDLLPNLVETVKQYMDFERETLTRVTELRSRAADSTLPSDQKIQVDNQIGQAMRGVMVQVENYPELKANQNFIQLQAAWNEIEEQISAARRTYNAAVMSYNNACEQFPTNLLAGMMNYSLKAYIEIPEEERTNISARELFRS